MADQASRRLAARIGAHARWARTLDRTAATAPARAALEAKWERMAREMHPDATEDEIKRAAESLRHAHLVRMALRSAEIRRKRRTAEYHAAEVERARAELRATKAGR